MGVFARGVGRFPGLQRPGLIEGWITPVPCSRAPTFPGLQRPGLIEGTLSPLTRTWSLSFRGFNAPASLKDQQREDLGEPVSLRFRGFNAPASLKDYLSAEYHGLRDEFPGLQRPGLIEGATVMRCMWIRSRNSRFRGFNAPASLKGGADALDVLARLGVSGVSTPRPH